MMVRIVWTDSGLHHDKGWETKEEILSQNLDLVDVVTVGELVHEEDDKYFVALSSDNINQSYYGIQVIGKFAVREFGSLMIQASSKTPLGVPDWDPTKESY